MEKTQTPLSLGRPPKERWQAGNVAFDSKGRQLPTGSLGGLLTDPTARIAPVEGWQLHGKYGYMSCFPPLSGNDEDIAGRLVSLGELVDWLMIAKGLPYREAVERLCEVLEKNSFEVGKWLYLLREHDRAKKAESHNFSRTLDGIDERQRSLDAGRIVASHTPGGPYCEIGMGALLHYIRDIWLGEIDDFGNLRNAARFGNDWTELKAPLYKTAILIDKAHELFGWGTATAQDSEVPRISKSVSVAPNKEQSTPNDPNTYNDLVESRKRNPMPTYDIAISFAGEDRPIAERLAAFLVSKGMNVFYDEYEKADLWGKDLYSHLSNVYRNEAKYCLMLISEHYAKKQWTNHERRAAQARAIAESTEYILPLRLDDARVEGILDTVGFIDYRKTAEEQIVDSLLQKIRAYNKAHGVVYEIVRVEDVFEKRAIGPKGGRKIKDSDMRTVCPACSIEQLLSEAELSLDAEETVYTCKHGCQPIVVVGKPGVVAWPGRGYRLGDHVVRNVRDILVKTEDMAETLVINAREAALMKKRPAG